MEAIQEDLKSRKHDGMYSCCGYFPKQLTRQLHWNCYEPNDAVFTQLLRNDNCVNNVLARAKDHVGANFGERYSTDKDKESF